MHSDNCEACKGDLTAICIHGSPGQRYARAYEEYEREVERGKANQKVGLKTNLSRGSAAKIVAEKHGLGQTSLKKFAKVKRADERLASDIAADIIKLDAAVKALRSDRGSDLHSDTYLSPRRLLAYLRVGLLGGKKFDLDPTSIASNPTKAKSFWTGGDTDDALNPGYDWASFPSIFMNPPYGEPGPFLERMATASRRNPNGKYIALVKFDPSTIWFQEAIKNASCIYMFGARIRFDKIENGERVRQDSANFPSCLIGYGPIQFWFLENSNDYPGVNIDLRANRAARPQDKSDLG